ncbi:MAG: glucose 1-dehydrogenase [Brevundimonas sp.]|jgi:NAD(P)-dependent dehydrogenase (short-subunit alcohol dehydrogenase family)|nr:glucose 1-dehydrogenase [Brevundimonas sp.]
MSSALQPEFSIDALAGLLKGEVAVVTGAGRGNGAAIAKGMAIAGARVCVADIDLQAATQVAHAIDPAGDRAIAVGWNIADPSQGDEVANRIREIFGAASILVNNAGVEAGGRIGDDGFEASWSRVMDVNLTGTLRAISALLPDLRKTRGSIVNIASIQSFIAYQGGTSAYATSKGALAQLTRSLATDFAEDGIRVNAVAPGFFETAMTQGTRSDPERMARFLSRTPLQRMGQPDELVGPVVFLGSRLSSYVTGTILPVDGGLLSC